MLSALERMVRTCARVNGFLTFLTYWAIRMPAAIQTPKAVKYTAIRPNRKLNITFTAYRLSPTLGLKAQEFAN